MISARDFFAREETPAPEWGPGLLPGEQQLTDSYWESHVRRLASLGSGAFAAPFAQGGRPANQQGMRWYISAAALKQFIVLCGLDAADNAVWDRCERELSSLCNAAKLTRDEGYRQIWRVVWRPEGQPKRRLELTVATAPRAEGPLDQLVRVRDKDAASRRPSGK